jgi:hypothetical protein
MIPGEGLLPVCFGKDNEGKRKRKAKKIVSLVQIPLGICASTYEFQGYTVLT